MIDISGIGAIPGLDVGMGEHHATAVTPAGKKSLDQRLPNSERFQSGHRSGDGAGVAGLRLGKPSPMAGGHCRPRGLGSGGGALIVSHASGANSAIPMNYMRIHWIDRQVNYTDEFQSTRDS
ncbi:hypothetical protein ACFYY2_14250 [Streptomyces sp. NPDC001822]|uniref:hypothetical protein n=1 Tax=Streptomyces sp. NPDC001822 TaxID=3364614 RepID=UPI003697086D